MRRLIAWLKFVLFARRRPKWDELDRMTCGLAGDLGHSLCGWCSRHHKPRVDCLCRVRSMEAC